MTSRPTVGNINEFGKESPSDEYVDLVAVGFPCMSSTGLCESSSVSVESYAVEPFSLFVREYITTSFDMSFNMAVSKSMSELSSQ